LLWRSDQDLKELVSRIFPDRSQFEIAEMLLNRFTAEEAATINVGNIESSGAEAMRRGLLDLASRKESMRKILADQETFEHEVFGARNQGPMRFQPGGCP